MESFATLIQNRRSTRKFTEQLLSPEQVELILKAALMAPASKRSNPWQFVVVEDGVESDEHLRVVAVRMFDEAGDVGHAVARRRAGRTGHGAERPGR